MENWLDGLLPDLPADRERWRVSAGAVQFEPVEEASDGTAAERTAVRPSALGPVTDADVAAALRFQRDGGPSPADIAGLLRNHSSDPRADITALLRRLICCWVIAANDAHAKNHALVHLPGGVCRLAPLYDTARALGTDPQWAAAEVMRIAREVPARLIAEID